MVSAVLWWWWPKFKIFLNTVSGRTPRKPEIKNIHMILGFLVYAIILAPAAIATFIGVGIATTTPTLISSTGVMGTTFACEGLPSVVIFTCSTPFSLGNRRKRLRGMRSIALNALLAMTARLARCISIPERDKLKLVVLPYVTCVARTM